MKKYSILVASALAAMAAFTSCDDQNECGCECSVPVINKIEKLDDTLHADIQGKVEAGSYVAIQGSNLGQITAVAFGDKVVNIKPAYRSANTLILQIPSVTKSCMGTFITNSCPTGYPMAQLGVIIGTPSVKMIYNEFVADGEWLKMKGSSFVGENMCVQFLMNDGTIANQTGENIQLPQDDGSEMYVKVPLGAAHSQYLNVVNLSELNEDGTNKQSVCPFMFRDYRNVLIDFDEISQYLYTPGAIAKDADGVYSIANHDDDTEWVMSVPKNYSTIPGVNNFGVFNNADDFQNISFVPNGVGLAAANAEISVLGAFKDEIAGGAIQLSSMTVKFEMYVPKEYSTNCMVYTLGFQGNRDASCGACRQFSAVLQQSEISWNKEDKTAGWQIASGTDFCTDGWMTVSVPFSEFRWNLEAMGYDAYAQNLTENDFDTAKTTFGNEEMHWSYAEENADAVTNPRKLTSKWGSFVIQINRYDGKLNTSEKNKKAHIAFDNFRIVPDDGNGALYPKLNYGKASRHYYN